jgi:protein SCO1/2
MRPSMPSSHNRRNGALARLVQSPLFWVAAILVLLGLPIARSMVRKLPPPPPVYQQLPDFTLTAEDGRPFARHQLDGKVWVADFVFTRCAGACPVLSQKMERIQRRTRNLGTQAFRQVSFSVDPEHDTPAELYAYARRFHANPRGWHFLTGPIDDVKAAITGAFKIYYGREQAEGKGFLDLVHGEQLVLVDQRARIRGYYEANDAGIDQLVSDVALLVNSLDAEIPPRPRAPHLP